MRCKGICYRFAAKKPVSGYRYAEGQKPCVICSIFVDTNRMITFRCPCCNNKLRMNSYKHKQNRHNQEMTKVCETNELGLAVALPLNFM